MELCNLGLVLQDVGIGMCACGVGLLVIGLGIGFLRLTFDLLL